MSQQDIEIVRANLEEFIRSPGATPHMSPDFVWDLTHYEGWPDKAVYAGLEEFIQFVDMWMEPFESWTMDVEELLDGGGGRIVVILHQRGRLKGSTAEVDMRYGSIYTVDGGLVVRADAYSPAERAFEAVGIEAR